MARTKQTAHKTDTQGKLTQVTFETEPDSTMEDQPQGTALTDPTTAPPTAPTPAEKPEELAQELVAEEVDVEGEQDDKGNSAAPSTSSQPSTSTATTDPPPTKAAQKCPVPDNGDNDTDRKKDPQKFPSRKGNLAVPGTLACSSGSMEGQHHWCQGQGKTSVQWPVQQPSHHSTPGAARFCCYEK